MEYVVIDNGEKLITWPTPEEATEYVNECRLEDIAEGEEDLHNYVIKGQEPRAEAAAKAKKTLKYAGLFGLVSRICSIIAWCLGFAWGIVWFVIKCLAKIIAYIVLSIFKLVLLCIQAMIALIVLIISIKSNVMD